MRLGFRAAIVGLVFVSLAGCGKEPEPAPVTRPQPARTSPAPQPAPAPAPSPAPQTNPATGGKVHRTPPATPAPGSPSSPSPAPGEAEPGQPEAGVPGTPAPTPGTPSASPGKSTSPTPAGITQVSSTKWTVTRSLANRWMDDPYALGNARESGAGWQLMGIRTRDAYHLGMRNGDIILEANGHKLDTKPQLLAAYLDMKNDTVFNVTFLRGGQRMTYTYQIVN